MKIIISQSYPIYDLQQCEKCHVWYVRDHKCELKLLIQETNTTDE